MFLSRDQSCHSQCNYQHTLIGHREVQRQGNALGSKGGSPKARATSDTVSDLRAQRLYPLGPGITTLLPHPPEGLSKAGSEVYSLALFHSFWSLPRSAAHTLGPLLTCHGFQAHQEADKAGEADTT